MNTAVVDGYELPVGTRVYIAQTATHYMEDIVQDPFTFDIDPYLPRSTEHRVPDTRPTGWARTPVSGHGGWSCSCP